MEERKGGFPSTRHSIIVRIRAGDDDARRDAFGELVEGYWKPLYKHLRVTWRLAPDDARDFTQGFFTEAFEKGWLERFEPAKARFRTFLRVCADRHVMKSRQAAARQKRGGAAQLRPVDFDVAEKELLSTAHAEAPDPDAFFHQEFVRALFDRAVRALRAEYEASGKATQFTIFERYDLAAEEGVSYASLAQELGMPVTQVTNHLAQVRRRFRQHALEALRGLCGTEEEFAREARDLFGVGRG